MSRIPLQANYGDAENFNPDPPSSSHPPDIQIQYSEYVCSSKQRLAAAIEEVLGIVRQG